MFVSENNPISFSVSMTVTGCANCPHAATNNHHERYCLLADTAYHSDRVSLCRDNASALTSSCPALSSAKPRVDPVVKGWYAALSDMRHCKALSDHARAKAAEIHDHLIETLPS